MISNSIKQILENYNNSNLSDLELILRDNNKDLFNIKQVRLGDYPQLLKLLDKYKTYRYISDPKIVSIIKNQLNVKNVILIELQHNTLTNYKLNNISPLLPLSLYPPYGNCEITIFKNNNTYFRILFPSYVDDKNTDFENDNIYYNKQYNKGQFAISTDISFYKVLSDFINMIIKNDFDIYLNGSAPKFKDFITKISAQPLLLKYYKELLNLLNDKRNIIYEMGCD